MIDLHTHVLPGMDDGSPDAACSVEMLRRQKEQGVEVVCGTSHYYRRQNSIAVFCERRAAALDRLTAALLQEKTLPRVIPAAEIAYFSGIGDHPGLERLCIQNTNTLMLEMPFTEWSDLQVEEVSSLVLDRGFQVVLVHPERFCASKGNRRKIQQMEQLPVALQVNAGALLLCRTRRLGLELLREAPIPLLASDCHNLTTRVPNLQEGRRVVQQKLGRDFLDRLDHNARGMVEPESRKNP